MSRLVVDSSIVIKWSVPEVHSADALRYLDPDLERDAPELLLAEVSNILWKKVGRGELTQAQAEKIAEDVEQADINIQWPREWTLGSESWQRQPSRAPPRFPTLQRRGDPRASHRLGDNEESNAGEPGLGIVRDSDVGTETDLVSHVDPRIERPLCLCLVRASPRRYKLVAFTQGEMTTR